MDNTVKRWLFWFPKVKWLQYTGEVGKCTRYWCQIFSRFNTPKSLKLVNFWQSYLKNKKVDVFWDTVYIIFIYILILLHFHCVLFGVLSLCASCLHIICVALMCLRCVENFTVSLITLCLLRANSQMKSQHRTLSRDIVYLPCCMVVRQTLTCIKLTLCGTTALGEYFNAVGEREYRSSPVLLWITATVPNARSTQTNAMVEIR